LIFSKTRRQFDILYRTHCSRIFRLAWKLGGFNRADAEDLMQDTFFRAFRRFHQYREQEQEAAWLTRICVNLARERWRRKQIYAEKVEPEFLPPIHDGNPESNPNQMAESQETGRTVQQALNMLDHPFREILVLRHMEGLSTKETAVYLGIPEGTVRSRLKRARHKLASYILKMNGELP
jgi:RNA polymerase sigma-70 factor, ECF subfamily